MHIASDFLVACVPDLIDTLLGDKVRSALFDNTKIKRFVPGYCATTLFARGIAQSIAWFDADPARQQIDHAADAQWDRLIDTYNHGLAAARSAFGHDR